MIEGRGAEGLVARQQVDELGGSARVKDERVAFLTGVVALAPAEDLAVEVEDGGSPPIVEGVLRHTECDMVQSRPERGSAHRRPFDGPHGRAIDLSAPEVDADPHPLFHSLRAEAPVHWSDTHRGWLAVSHAAVGDGFRAPWLSSDRVPVFERAATKRPPEFARVVELLRGWMVFRDPPAHERLRDPVRRVFTPLRLERLTPMIERTADDLLDDLADA